MLIEFSVENFRSFKERATLSMVAANIKSEDSELDENALTQITPQLDLLKCAGIYGANASGKSNFIAAFQLMHTYVIGRLQELRIPQLIHVEPFLLSTETEGKPSFFEVVFAIGSTQYRYGFEVTRHAVVSEWLFHCPKKNEQPLFIRTGQVIELSGAFAKEGKDLEQRTRPNVLFLTVAAEFNGEVSKKIVDWFLNMVVTTGLTDHFRPFTRTCLKDEENKNQIVNLLKKLDLGFDDLILSDINEGDLPPNIPEDQQQLVLDLLSTQIYSIHSVFDERGKLISQTKFDIDVKESQGTQKLIALAGVMNFVLHRRGVLVIDELDARLHPIVTRRIIEIFNTHETNPNGAQLIFSTHDTSLLDKTLLRRDQIWFAEKDPRTGTKLTSLVEYRPRNDAAIEKNYLQGRYGAIPYLGDISRLPGVSNAA